MRAGAGSPKQTRLQAVGSAGNKMTHSCLCRTDTEQRKQTRYGWLFKHLVVGALKAEGTQ